jgi:O-methyltransferase
MFKLFSRTAERLCGVRITRIASEQTSRLADLSPEIQLTIGRAQPYTMTSPERLAALCMAAEHVAIHEIRGAFVECGVWRGGSSMAAAWTFSRLRRNDIDMYLFDTFEGMSEPSAEDVDATSGKLAIDLLATNNRDTEIWAYAPLEDVRKNLESTGYPSERFHFIKGMVEETIPRAAPGDISILRLDTDWYESTKHELVHLFPRLSEGGILIIDDYGAWAGARKAVDEYFAASDLKPFLARIDFTGRIYVKSSRTPI